METSDDAAGQSEFRARINPLIRRYGSGYELRETGEIWRLTTGTADLALPVPTDDDAIDAKVQRATSKFFQHDADEADKREAVRELADVMEYLHGTLGTKLPRKDEDRLLEIANQFGIRHHNQRQLSNYDADIWLEWIFHAFLGAIRLVTRLLARNEEYEVTRCPACHQPSLVNESWAEPESDGNMVGGNYRACTNCRWTSN